MRFVSISAATLALFVATGCGAPTKSAGQVASLFQGDARSLQEKMTSLCQELTNRTAEPNFSNMSINLEGCKGAGDIAQDLKAATSLKFRGLDGEEAGGKDQVISRNLRGQVWLNKSLLGVAAVVSKKLKEAAAKGGNTGLLSFGGSGESSGLENIAQVDINVLEEPVFDTENFTFTTKINLVVSKIVDINNTIAVSGGLVDRDKIAVVVKSGEDQPINKSLIKSFEAALFIVPHGGDLYLDLFIDLNMYSPGLTDLLNSQITTFLNSGLKKIIDGFLTL